MQREFHLIDYLPPYMQGYQPIKELCAAETPELQLLMQESEKIKDNQFILTCDSEGLKRFESMLGIAAEEKEPLLFRKERVLNRLFIQAPYTLRYLGQKLDTLIGKEKWSVVLDRGNYCFYLETDATEQIWAEEIAVTIDKIKPCNLIFINRPLLPDAIHTSEAVCYSEWCYGCQLGVWGLGSKPFVDNPGYSCQLGLWALGKGAFLHFEEREVPSTVDQVMIQSGLLNSIAAFAASSVASVRVNGEIPLYKLDAKQVEGNVLSITYTVSPE